MVAVSIITCGSFALSISFSESRIAFLLSGLPFKLKDIEIIIVDVLYNGCCRRTKDMREVLDYKTF